MHVPVEPTPARGDAPAAGTLILSRREVAALLDLDDCIDAVEAAFRADARGDTIAPRVLGVPLEGGGFHIKTAGLGAATPYFAAKLNGNFEANAERFGLPRIQGLIILADARNGYPLAVLDSVEITAQRTAAASAVAARYLARPDASTVTICGCGRQGRAQLDAIRRVRPIRRVHAVDRDPGAARRFATDVGAALGLPIEAADDLPAVARASQIVVTCTPSRRPLLGTGDVAAGTFIAAVGADSEEKQELAPELVAQATLVVDHREQCASIGELHHAVAAGLMGPRDVHADLADVVAGRRPGRRTDDEIIVFDSTGVALEDVAAAALVYEAARAGGVGTLLRLL